MASLWAGMGEYSHKMLRQIFLGYQTILVPKNDLVNNGLDSTYFLLRECHKDNKTKNIVT